MLYFPTSPKPDRLQLKSPTYISTSKEFAQGATLYKRTQFVGATTRLQLAFSFISQSELDAIIGLWNDSEGQRVFELPSGFFDSYPAELKNAIARLKATKYWRMLQPEYTPRIQSQFDGVAGKNRWNRYDITLDIISEIS